MAIPFDVKAIYQTVGSVHVIKSVHGPSETLAEVQAIQAAVSGYDGVVTILTAQLQSAELTDINAMLGWEYYDDSGTAKVRSLVQTNAYKLAVRKPPAEQLFQDMLNGLKWGLGFHFKETPALGHPQTDTRIGRTGMWMRKLFAVINIDAVIQSDTHYAALINELELDGNEWMVYHDSDGWSTHNIGGLVTTNLNWYTTNNAWGAVLVSGVTVNSQWHAKNLLEELR